MRKNKEKSVAKRTIYYYLAAAKKYRWSFIAAMVAQIITIAIQFAGPYIIAQIIDRLINENFTPDQLLPVFGPHIIAFVGLGAASAIIGNLSGNIWWKAEIKVAYDLAMKVYDSLVYRSSRFHNDHFGGSLVSQTNKFVSKFEDFADTLVWNIMSTLLTIVFTIAILAPLVPIYAAIITIFSVIFVIVSYLYFSKIRPLNEAIAKAENKQSGQLSDSISNIMTVKSYAGEIFEKARFSRYSKKTRAAGTVFADTIMMRSFVFSLVGLAVNAAVLIFAIGSNAWFGISVGTLVMMITYSTTLLNSLWGFDQVFRRLNRAFGDAREMTLILDESIELTDATDMEKLIINDGEVKFNDVTFAHADGKDAVFHHLNLDIKSGQRIGLVGRSGSGKTTLTKLLLRFADVDGGKITIDDQNIAKVTQESLRKNIAYVPQETTLFHRTIAENIAYGRPNATKNEIIKAAKLANAWEFIKDLPKGLDTLTGERGVKLSGGQRQRVAIARAILKDAPILVLDEATASLDTESEKKIQEALGRLMKNRTSIVVAHRLSTVAEMDRIIVLDDGKIVEDDTHQNLIEKGGIYSKLWNKQTGIIE